MLIYRLDVPDPPPPPPAGGARFVIARGPGDAARRLRLWAAAWGWAGALKAFAKACTGRRLPFGMVADGRLVTSCWANVGFCRHYRVEPDAVVFGTGYTSPEFRGRGLLTEAVLRTIGLLRRRGYTRFYVDTTAENLAARRMIAKAGFQELPP